MQARALTQLARDLQPDFRVIALNMRGHGLSDAPKGGYTDPAIPSETCSIRRRVRACTRLHPHWQLAGHAGRAALCRASSRADRPGHPVRPEPCDRAAGDRRLCRAAPLAAAHLRHACGGAAPLHAHLPQRAGLSPSMHALTEIGDFRENDQGRFEWCYDLNGILETFQNLRIDQWPDVRRIKAPTLVMRAATSHVLSYDNALRLEKELPDGTLVEIPNSSHTIWGDRPDLLSDLTQRFLSGRGLNGGWRNSAGALTHAWRVMDRLSSMHLSGPPPRPSPLQKGVHARLRRAMGRERTSR